MFVYTYICFFCKQCQNGKFDEFGDIFYPSISTAGVKEAPFYQLFDTFLKIIKDLELILSNTFQICKAIWCNHKT